MDWFHDLTSHLIRITGCRLDCSRNTARLNYRESERLHRMDQTSSLQDRAKQLTSYNSALSLKKRTGPSTNDSGVIRSLYLMLMAFALLISQGSVHILSNCVFRYLCDPEDWTNAQVQVLFLFSFLVKYQAKENDYKVVRSEGISLIRFQVCCHQPHF